MLHGVSDSEHLDNLKPWVITRDSFVRLLDYIENQGYNTIVYEDLLSGNLTKKNTIITFDDCPKHLMDFALPELLKRQMKAVFYMPTAYLGGYNEWNADDGLAKMELMNEDDIKYLVENGMEVGSHGHKHIMYEEVGSSEVISAFRKSKDILERIIKKKVITAAYPYGSVPRLYHSIMKDIGYEFALSVYSVRETRYNLRRWAYYDTDTIDLIKTKMSYRYASYRSFADGYNYYSTLLLRKLYVKYAFLKKSLQRQ